MYSRNFDDTRPVLQETVPPHLAMADPNPMESLVEADLTFGRSINFRGGRAGAAALWHGKTQGSIYPEWRLRLGPRTRARYMGPFWIHNLKLQFPFTLNHVGGYLAASQELGYTYGTMQEGGATDEASFRANYLRLWRPVDRQ